MDDLEHRPHGVAGLAGDLGRGASPRLIQMSPAVIEIVSPGRPTSRLM
jgi:hypothetical protein